MGITKEQEGHSKKMIEINRTETNYVCLKCKYRFIGMDEVRGHVDKEKHYEYKPLHGTGNMVLMIG